MVTTGKASGMGRLKRAGLNKYITFFKGLRIQISNVPDLVVAL